MKDVEIVARATEHDWSGMPMRLRLGIAWSVLRGRPFAVHGEMRILALNVTPRAAALAPHDCPGTGTGDGGRG